MTSNFDAIHKMPPKNEIWTHDAELKLIDYFRERRWLWDSRDSQYHRTELRSIAYEECARGIGPHVTAIAVEKRWANLKTTFNTNHKKMIASCGQTNQDGDLKKPTWPLYKTLLFLSGTVKRRASKSADTSGTSFQPRAGSSFLGADEVFQYDTDFCELEEISGTVEVVDDSYSRATSVSFVSGDDHDFYSKKLRGSGSKDMSVKFDEALGVLKNIDAKKMDEYDHFGCVVANALRNMTPLTAEFAKLEIQRTLYDCHVDNPKKFKKS